MIGQAVTSLQLAQAIPHNITTTAQRVFELVVVLQEQPFHFLGLVEHGMEGNTVFQSLA